MREITGLVLDPYFSGSKVEWLLANRDIPIDDDLALGTIDSWLLWNLTGGEVHATDPSNASRTMLFDIRSLRVERRAVRRCSACRMHALPAGAAVERPLRRHLRALRRARRASRSPASPATSRRRCSARRASRPGMAKNTYGTGSFVLMNVGATCPPPTEGMLTTVAWTLADGTVAYALEGAIFVTGAAVQWLRDGLGIIASAAEIGPLAASVADNGGVYVVPAFTGLGSPWWDPYARGTIVGITRGTTKAHLARAVVEAMAYQTRDVVDAMAAASGTTLPRCASTAARR